MQERLTIIKVGGKVVENAESLETFIQDFSKIAGHKILVHGGGRSATAIAEKLGIETKMVDGRRITDTDTLNVVVMVYGGLVNKNIVAQLQTLNKSAIGLCGADLDLIRAKKREVKDVDYGYVGDVTSVNTEQLNDLIKNEVIPVIAPLTHDGKGQLLNTNADTIAAELAKAFAMDFSVQLAYCFEKSGVLTDPNNDNSVITNLNTELYQTYKDDGTISDGMIPKLDNGFSALKHGVKQVLISNSEGLKNGFSKGTQLEL
ncbi:acetylglutamate kinase [Carboxylicivirga sp. N1Y90]|uniref:acetylglutamate kinase n=1 Tax=Carboxylicivirga fragile TaxID=3417571 RepID=UPI003D347BC7|nr:acetylglutamate kinase [Marinilabiliaceae bacterium N1Y90]